MNETIKGQLNTYCQFVKCGKPTAMMALQDRYTDNAIDIVKGKYDLSIHIEYLSEGWITLWIYKYDYMLEVIKKLPEKPKTIYDHWVLGKVFGYSDESIKEFLGTNFYNTQYAHI